MTTIDRCAVRRAPCLAIIAAAVTLLTCGSRPEAMAVGKDPDACALLTLAEVRGVFPDVAGNKPDNSLKQHGVFACIWRNAADHQVFQTRVDTDTTVQEQISMFASGITAPGRSGLRGEAVTGLGEGAASLIVHQDTAKGVLSNLGLLTVQRGKDTISVVTSSIGGKTRTQVLQEMTQLARAALARL